MGEEGLGTSLGSESDSVCIAMQSSLVAGIQFALIAVGLKVYCWHKFQ